MLLTPQQQHAEELRKQQEVKSKRQDYADWGLGTTQGGMVYPGLEMLWRTPGKLAQLFGKASSYLNPYLSTTPSLSDLPGLNDVPFSGVDPRVKPQPPAGPKPPSPSAATAPAPGGPPPFVPTTATTETLPTGPTPPASAAPKDPRFRPGDAPTLSEPTRGARPDFSDEDAQIAAMAQSPGGFKQAFYRSLLSGMAPDVVKAHDQERNLQISLAEKNLQQEKEESDMDFRRQEALKDQMYLSQFGERLGKVYGTDSSTGLSGFFSPMEVAGLHRSDLALETQRLQLEKQLEALGNQGGYYAAMAENLRAQAAKADRSEDLALIAGLAANARSGVASDPMGLSGVNWGQELQGTSDMMKSRLGVPGQAPAQGAPPAPPAGPLEQKGLSLGLPPEIAKGIDRLDTPTKKAAALEKLKKDPKYSEFTQVLGQLLGGQ